MEQFILRSGSSNIFIIDNGITKTIKKTINFLNRYGRCDRSSYRKCQKKFEKELKALNILDKYKHFPKIIKSTKKNNT